jgi:hypothetical protein
MVVRMWGKRNPHILLVGMYISTTTMENSKEAPQKTKNRIPLYPAIPLLGIYPKECESGYNKGACTPMFIATLFTIAKLWKQPTHTTTDEWIKKMYLYTM